LLLSALFKQFAKTSAHSPDNAATGHSALIGGDGRPHAALVAVHAAAHRQL
jgi:hypothetical protein